MKSTITILSLLIFACLTEAQNSSENQTKKLKKQVHVQAKNIILMIGDGMGVSQIYAGMTANHGHLNIEQFQNIGFSKTYSYNDYVTDSGAAATALASGKKTFNDAIGVDADTLPTTSILEYAEKNNKVTGLIVTCSVTHATPASFIAHQSARNKAEEIATDFLKTDIEVFIGGGLKYFNHRNDQLDLTKTLVANGYKMVYTPDSLQTTKGDKIAGLLWEEHGPKISGGRGDMLVSSTLKTLEVLSHDSDGFFLMIEGSQIDWGGHDNDTKYIIDELLDFDRVIGKVLDFAQKNGNTLVIVTADHETGGMTLNGGNIEKGEVNAKFTTSEHTGVMVPVFAYGPGSESFRGIYENTEIFNKMMVAFGFEKK
jgi:alkaline phosphatase